MKDLKDIKAVYFLGIGGIGMSALARYFNSNGVRVSGYDKTPTPLTDKLQQEGISIHFEDNTELIDKEAELVVYTPAVPKDHKEYNYLLSHHYTVLKRSDVLGMITKGTYSICIAGTHGKTTTSSMVAHILRDSGFGCNAFLGGIASNYATNFWYSEKNVSVAEADEYDRSFLKLFPDIAVITAMDPDHLDIYGTPENLQDAFVEFANQVKPGGLLIYKSVLKRSDEFKAAKISYSVSDSAADVHPVNIKISKGSYVFDLEIKGELIKDVELNMGGMHNIENAVAAIAVAKHVGIEDDKIRAAVASFRGVKRRFEYIIKNDERVMIDDYAHHPEELRVLINGAKGLFPGQKCTVVFQPHLFSRTNDFADGFAEVLSMADELILLPIYPAREKPMEAVNSEMILNRMKHSNARVLSKEALLEEMKNTKPVFLITAGAGDIDMLVEPIKKVIQ
ncbi:MAG: UDP-N-acetylmuramate--L-alanine ligase [Bacteroidetes bacterium]|nr:UDP-N-acetylmuramate--L-alanine ligase [Bacteroidota bacterium]